MRLLVLISVAVMWSGVASFSPSVYDYYDFVDIPRKHQAASIDRSDVVRGYIDDDPGLRSMETSPAIQSRHYRDPQRPSYKQQYRPPFNPSPRYPSEPFRQQPKPVVTYRERPVVGYRQPSQGERPPLVRERMPVIYQHKPGPKVPTRPKYQKQQQQQRPVVGDDFPVYGAVPPQYAGLPSFRDRPGHHDDFYEEKVQKLPLQYDDSPKFFKASSSPFHEDEEVVVPQYEDRPQYQDEIPSQYQDRPIEEYLQEDRQPTEYHQESPSVQYEEEPQYKQPHHQEYDEEDAHRPIQHSDEIITQYHHQEEPSRPKYVDNPPTRSQYKEKQPSRPLQYHERPIPPQYQEERPSHLEYQDEEEPNLSQYRDGPTSLAQQYQDQPQQQESDRPVRKKRPSFPMEEMIKKDHHHPKEALAASSVVSTEGTVKKRQAIHYAGAGDSEHLDAAGKEFVADASAVEHGKTDGRLAFQIHGQQGPHSYRFGYDTGKGYNRQFRYEERDGYGQVHGRYGFYDKDGKLQVVNYSAHPEHGFSADVPH
ncbi:hypothetical protein Pcinc_008682 [Petrolisthes cinctipes]|uniref:Uncharacterized protein n=1 Tax=Petrolisthes cinctipes TaxID=88211 RepID=A0AAE1G8C7_PETCI|nr:hypothetical protein Pcinc_008682 [Petrolisthes cinctipes]